MGFMVNTVTLRHVLRPVLQLCPASVTSQMLRNLSLFTDAT